MNEKVTGKQIASETLTLVKHIGEYLSDALSNLCTGVKDYFSKRKSDSKQSKPS